MNALGCLLTVEKKGVKKVIGKIVHDLRIEKGIRKIDENNLMNQIRIIKLEIETIRAKIEYESRDEVNDATIQEDDNIADIYVESDVINHTDSANEEPIEITENDLSDSKRDRLLRLREALEDNDFGKTEVNLKYGDQEKLKKSYQNK